ncbi:MAG: YkgJ family cysteine cluster protein [Proteobacteria bacterium]|nr:YkgJ family cysteine cluster protein [Pseudomonadota bacterium]
MAKQYWQNGLHFECQRCGKCCCGETGIVYFSPEEFDALAQHLEKHKGISRETLQHDFMTPCDDSYSTREGHCIFFENGCTVYEVRPSQCRTFPFWRSILLDKNAWQNVAKTCCGMNNGKFWSAEEIRAIAAKSRL